MKTKSPVLLSEIESAIYLKISPELLRYLTSRSVKSGEKRKLVCTEKDGVRRYDKDELDSFDSYLREPWPKKKDAQRPHLPDKFKAEIKLEAACACPVCGYEAAGDVAHIVPVSKTLSHHPGNLIWLCPNHHRVVDKVLVPHNVKMETIRALKEVLVDRKLRVLNLELAASKNFLQLIRQVEMLSDMIEDKALAEAKGGLQAIAKLDVTALGNTAFELANSGAKDKQEVPLQAFAFSISKSIENVDPSENQSLAALAAEAATARARYLKETGQVDCPVCAGKRGRNGSNCSACDGEGALDAAIAHQIDVTDYEDMECPLCCGSGRRNGNDCPVCGGEGKFERRFRDRIDLRDYNDVDCPVCDGEGRRDGQICNACGGERKMERRFADQIDQRDYQDVECPLCSERGEERDCPVCDGEYRIERRYADQIDLRDYLTIDCKLCEGSGRAHHEDCPACGGDGEMERRYYDKIDWSEWDDVDCPKCDGSGRIKQDDCRYCGGEGTIYRRQAWYQE